MKILTLILTLFIITQADAKKFYKWVDADGNTHYSETKPVNKQTSEVKVYANTPTGVTTTYQSRKDKEKAAEEESNGELSQEQKDVEEYNKKERERVQKKQDKANCKIAKKNLETLQTTTRIRKKDPSTGEYIRMDDTQRIQMLKKVKKSIKELCH